MQVVSNFSILMQKAYALGQAKESGDEELIRKAKLEHDIYRDICLNSDVMSLDCTYGDLI